MLRRSPRRRAFLSPCQILSTDVTPLFLASTEEAVREGTDQCRGTDPASFLGFGSPGLPLIVLQVHSISAGIFRSRNWKSRDHAFPLE